MKRARDVLPHGQAKAVAVRDMFDRIAPRYDLLNRALTFGLDVRWRRRAVADLALPSGAMVFDLACGTGDFCVELLAAGHRAIGFDFALGMLRAGRTEAPLVQADILRLPASSASADGITCGFALRNVVDLDALFAECARIVRPGGRIALLEVATPSSPLVRAGHRLYFHRVVPFIGGLVSDRGAYAYLPKSTEYLPAPEQLDSMLGKAGFERLRRSVHGGGAAQLLTGTRT